MDKPTSRKRKTEISNDIFNEEGGKRNKWGSRDVKEPGEFGKRPSERYRTPSDKNHDEEDLSTRNYEAHVTEMTPAEPRLKISKAASSVNKSLVKDMMVTSEEVPAAATTHHQRSVRNLSEDSGRRNLPEERYADPVPDPRRRGAIWFGYPSGQGHYEASRMDEETSSEAKRK